jgi:DNA-directed RNA polymerase specialized sigma24 family protein
LEVVVERAESHVRSGRDFVDGDGVRASLGHELESGANRRSRSNAMNQLSDCLAVSIPPRGDARLSAAQYLSRLPERQRTVLLLRTGFGYTIEEISELTQSPENTVKDRLKRARTALRRQLERERSAESPHREPRMMG